MIAVWDVLHEVAPVVFSRKMMTTNGNFERYKIMILYHLSQFRER